MSASVIADRLQAPELALAQNQDVIGRSRTAEPDLSEPTLTIPEDVESDLHSLRAVWVRVTFAATRLGVVRIVGQT
jgi:hypothetical protein